MPSFMGVGDNLHGYDVVDCPSQWRAVGYTGAALERGGVIFLDVGAHAT